MAALLCWLDARSRGARVLLRLEDLDPDRCRPEWSDAMRRDLEWMGLDWDGVHLQSESRARHAAALDRLASQGHLYPCSCSRGEIRERGVEAPDGSSRYPGTCRARRLPSGGWRASDEPLRLALPMGRLALADESGADLSQDVLAEMGDPVVRRRDGALAYHLASVVDDAHMGVTRIVRGRDLLTTTATQVTIRRLLKLPDVTYRHHLLLLEERGGKLAKLHGSVGAPELRAEYDAAALCGLLARAAGLVDTPEPTTPAALLAAFSWKRVCEADRVLAWDGRRLSLR
jgi:glutamyl/glutaminyl-tRNA synthetase